MLALSSKRKHARLRQPLWAENMAEGDRNWKLSLLSEWNQVELAQDEQAAASVARTSSVPVPNDAPGNLDAEPGSSKHSELLDWLEHRKCVGPAMRPRGSTFRRLSSGGDFSRLSSNGIMTPRALNYREVGGIVTEKWTRTRSLSGHADLSAYGSLTAPAEGRGSDLPRTHTDPELASRCNFQDDWRVDCPGTDGSLTHREQPSQISLRRPSVPSRRSTSPPNPFRGRVMQATVQPAQPQTNVPPENPARSTHLSPISDIRRVVSSPDSSYTQPRPPGKARRASEGGEAKWNRVSSASDQSVHGQEAQSSEIGKQRQADYHAKTEFRSVSQEADEVEDSREQTRTQSVRKDSAERSYFSEDRTGSQVSSRWYEMEEERLLIRDHDKHETDIKMNDDFEGMDMLLPTVIDSPIASAHEQLPEELQPIDSTLPTTEVLVRHEVADEGGVTNRAPAELETDLNAEQYINSPWKREMGEDPAESDLIFTKYASKGKVLTGCSTLQRQVIFIDDRKPIGIDIFKNSKLKLPEKKTPSSVGVRLRLREIEERERQQRALQEMSNLFVKDRQRGGPNARKIQALGPSAQSMDSLRLSLNGVDSVICPTCDTDIPHDEDKHRFDVAMLFAKQEQWEEEGCFGDPPKVTCCHSHTHTAYHVLSSAADKRRRLQQQATSREGVIPSPVSGWGTQDESQIDMLLDKAVKQADETPTKQVTEQSVNQDVSIDKAVKPRPPTKPKPQPPTKPKDNLFVRKGVQPSPGVQASNDLGPSMQRSPLRPYEKSTNLESSCEPEESVAVEMELHTKADELLCEKLQTLQAPENEEVPAEDGWDRANICEFPFDPEAEIVSHFGIEMRLASVRSIIEFISREITERYIQTNPLPHDLLTSTEKYAWVREWIRAEGPSGSLKLILQSNIAGGGRKAKKPKGLKSKSTGRREETNDERKRHAENTKAGQGKGEGADDEEKSHAKNVKSEPGKGEGVDHEKKSKTKTFGANLGAGEVRKGWIANAMNAISQKSLSPLDGIGHDEQLSNAMNAVAQKSLTALEGIGHEQPQETMEQGDNDEERTDSPEDDHVEDESIAKLVFMNPNPSLVDAGPAAMWSHAKSKLRGALGALGPLHFSRRPKKEEKPKDVSEKAAELVFRQITFVRVNPLGIRGIKDILVL